ncbi:PilZ domain-containing protein [Gracilibacillus saliphilus]|uniref:PilZ domain-containing protein n=1 Tax=Gracilibacillus saliphilus TaxID=543890 RepID=UPI001EE1761C|nr:PilZ domain-containing protein [Gracilibacillus saliphilus]
MKKEVFHIELIVLTQIIISVIALIVTVTFYFKHKKSKDHQKESRTPTNPELLEANIRNNFRITLHQQPCLITLIHLENAQLSQLTNKQFYGYVDNISTSGLMFLCNFNFPVKDRVTVQLNISIKSYHFTLNGEVIRKEEHKKKKQIAYGVQFHKMSEKERIRLTKVLNEVMVEKKKMSNMVGVR